MRRLYPLFLLALLVIGLTACNDDEKRRCLDHPQGRWDEKNAMCRYSTGTRG